MTEGWPRGPVGFHALPTGTTRQDATLRLARGWAANHTSGSSSASRSTGWVGSRSSTSLQVGELLPRRLGRRES